MSPLTATVIAANQAEVQSTEHHESQAFRGKCPVQVSQVSITETMLDEARDECNRLELRRRCVKEENRLSEGTALERDEEARSLVDRTYFTT